ncbi:MAG: ParA family protein [Sphingomonadales bacterium]|nr:ParA family protein [Sphingomonadales bacterium]
MAKIIAVYSMKGGVGKSTVAVNLAWNAAGASARRTLLWDIDAQGAASFLFGHDGSTGKASRIFAREVTPASMIEKTAFARLDLLAGDLSLRQLGESLAEADKPKRLRKLLQTLAADYDRVILDCPPGLGELSDQLFRAADLIVAPVLPTPLALRALDQVRDHLARHHAGKPVLLPVFSMVDRRKTLHRETLAAHPSWIAIPQASVVERMAVERAPLGAFAPRSPAARAFGELWTRVEANP